VQDFPTTKIGFPQMQHVGPSGEEGGRFLLGWAGGVTPYGAPDEYYVVEADAEGRLFGERTKLDGTGWGEEDAWVHLPKSRCIVRATHLASTLFMYRNNREVEGGAGGGRGRVGERGLVDFMPSSQIRSAAPQTQ
jgi:hypothetical protein